MVAVNYSTNLSNPSDFDLVLVEMLQIWFVQQNFRSRRTRHKVALYAISWEDTAKYLLMSPRGRLFGWLQKMEFPIYLEIDTSSHWGHIRQMNPDATLSLASDGCRLENLVDGARRVASNRRDNFNADKIPNPQPLPNQ